MKLVLDASVALEVLLATPVGLSLIPSLKAATLLAPELIDVEVLSVIRRETRAGRLSLERAETAISDLRAWGIRRQRHRPLLADAWSVRDRVTAYDALYVAVAMQHGATLLTADGPLSRVPGLGVVVQNVLP